jgi:hypothetical protein
MVVCQQPRVGLGEHYFLMKYAEEVSASLGCIRLLYSTNWANYATLPRARTQKTQKHTTTNMSRRRPTNQQLWPSLSMATCAMNLYLGVAAPYGPEAGAVLFGVLSPLPVPLIGVPTRASSKNREEGGALALGGRQSMTTTNNQPDSRRKR